MQFEIGARLKNLRKEQNMSIADLAAKSNVSTGLISQIERDMVVPSVVNLYRIAQTLNTDINYFFENDRPSNMKLIRKGDHRVILTNRGTSRYELLGTERSDRTLDMVRVTLRGGETYDHETVSHTGEECGIVLQGIMTVLLDGREYDLHEGDSIYFDSSLPHKYLNNTEEDCVSIWSMTPTFF